MLLKGFFHSSIFPAMEGEDHDAAAGFEEKGSAAEEGIERGELFIDGDAQGLKDASGGVATLIMRGLLHGVNQLLGVLQMLACE